MEYHVTVETKGKLLRGQGPKVVKENLTAAMYEATMFLEREVKKRTPKGVFGAQGGLNSTIHGEVRGKGSPVVRGIVAHGSKYGNVIEKGRRAGKAWPPEGTLLRWIEVKLGVEGSEAKRLEFVIRRKIGRKGFEGAHMFEDALEQNWGKVERIFDNMGFKIVRELDQ
jgi:hypothetical protein